jgi:hypothetical protein
MTPEEAHAINRLLDPAPKTDPLRRYVAVYRTKGAIHLSAIAFTNQIAAWTMPRGPNVPRDLEIVDVIDVKYSPREPLVTKHRPDPELDHTLSVVSGALNEPQQGG